MSKEIVVRFLSKLIVKKLDILKSNPSPEDHAKASFHLVNIAAIMKSLNENRPLTETYEWALKKFSFYQQKVHEAHAIAPQKVEDQSMKIAQTTSSIFKEASETGEIAGLLNANTAEFAEAGNLIKHVLTGQVTDHPAVDILGE